jgi:hypothetical protein
VAEWPGFYGDPGSLKRQAERLREIGTRLLEMKTDIDQRVDRLVPGSWDGPAAREFREMLRRQMDFVLQLHDAADGLMNADNVLAEGLSEAKRMFQVAQSHLAERDCWIDPSSLEVFPFNASSEANWAAANQIQAEVDRARADADLARRLAASVYESNFACWHGLLEGWEGLLCSLLPSQENLSSWVGTGALKGKWPVPGAFGSKTLYGTAFHSAMAKLNRALGNASIVDKNWKLIKIEQTVGGTKRVDALYVNEREKKLFIEDYFTGEVESATHAYKTGSYLGEPEIAALRAKGWDVQSGTAFSHPSHQH